MVSKNKTSDSLTLSLRLGFRISDKIERKILENTLEEKPTPTTRNNINKIIQPNQPLNNCLKKINKENAKYKKLSFSNFEFLFSRQFVITTRSKGVNVFFQVYFIYTESRWQLRCVINFINFCKEHVWPPIAMDQSFIEMSFWNTKLIQLDSKIFFSFIFY